MLTNQFNLAVGLLFSITLTYAQIPLPQITTIGNNPMAAAQHLAGPGVTIHSASFSGDVDQCALFTNGEEAIGFKDGLALTTGNASLAGQHMVSCAGCDTESRVNDNTAGPDPDIALLTNYGQDSPATLQFTFSSVNDHIEFEFVFASLEYPGFVNTEYNDRFLFCLSGPGISGPFYNGAENIARLPNGDFISINTVNGGNIFEPATNPEYFKANYPIVNPITHYWRYNGQTVPIKIVRNIQCNVQYTLKLVIANIDDHRRDSGVFFKKGSLKADYNLGALTTTPSLVCEGQPISLNVTGDNGYTYTWSTGQQGVNLKSISPASSLDTTTYSVEAIAPNGCTIGTRSVNITVHPNNNQPPYMNGINNTGVYKAYVRAGENISFQMPTFDNPNENVFFNHISTLPGADHEKILTNQQIGVFGWTPSENQIGVHSFQVEATDQNVCYNLSSDYTFTIIVVCPYCEIGIDYNNRNPSNSPVPPLTEMAEYITAGLEGPVVLGEPTIFRAGDRIVLDEFEPGDEFLAEITPICDEEVCEDCCTDHTGLIEPTLPNVFTPNGDGINDVWYAADYVQPYCAFNAQFFELFIYDRSGVLVYQLTDQSNSCCHFQSPPSPESPGYSSIFWTGIFNTGSGSGNYAIDGVYDYVLYLRGCNDAFNAAGTISIYGASSGRWADSTSTDERLLSKHSPQEFRNSTKTELVAYPNPINEFLTLQWLYRGIANETYYAVYDASGRLIESGVFSGESIQLNTSHWASGLFNCVVTTRENFVHSFKIAKQ